MNALINWGNQLKVGDATIDRQHQELIRIANRLYMAMKERRGRDVLGSLLVDLSNYTNWHFDTEERLMRQHHYPSAKAQFHIREHAKLKHEVAKLSERARCGTLEIPLEAMNFLRDWLSHHIQSTDKELGGFLDACRRCQGDFEK